MFSQVTTLIAIALRYIFANNQDISTNRLCQFTAKFVNGILHLYHKYYATGGVVLLETIYRLRELEQYISSCRRALNFGRCTDQLYSSLKSTQLYDPVFRTTIATSKLWGSLQMFSEHVLWLQNVGIINVDKHAWIERANRFWLYSVTFNLLRDFYELICVIQKRQGRRSEDSDSKHDSRLSAPLIWIRENPKLSCDLIKNTCDFCIPYSYDKKIVFHPSVIGLLGMTSSVLGILQIYDKKYMLSPN